MSVELDHCRLTIFDLSCACVCVCVCVCVCERERERERERESRQDIHSTTDQ